MAYTQSDLDKLQAAMARGAKRLKMGDEEVEFRSLAEMQALEKQIKAALGLTSSRRTITPSTTSGWR